MEHVEKNGIGTLLPSTQGIFGDWKGRVNLKM